MVAVIYTFIIAWLVTGLIFAIPFALTGAQHIPRVKAALSAGARLLVIPGAMVLWPWLLWRWTRAFDRKARK